MDYLLHLKFGKGRVREAISERGSRSFFHPCHFGPLLNKNPFTNCTRPLYRNNPWLYLYTVMTIMGFKHTPTEQVQRVLRKDHLNSSESGSNRRTYLHTEPDMIIAVPRSRVDLVGYTFAKNPSTFFPLL